MLLFSPMLLFHLKQFQYCNLVLYAQESWNIKAGQFYYRPLIEY